MTNFLKWIGVLAIAGGIFFAGVVVGEVPTDEQENQAAYEGEVRDDLITLGGKYADIYNICEQKYQFAINGDFDSAYQLKGRQDILAEQIREIWAKYDSSSKITF